MPFCITCGNRLGEARRPGSECCDNSCAVKAARAIKSGKKTWRFCAECGHTEEMHDDGERRRICMEQVGPQLEGWCHCRALVTNPRHLTYSPKH